jgi:Zn-dependent M28 family amino/carboxypeptidase
VILTRLQKAPQKDTEREMELGKMFRAVGCEPTEQPVKHLRQPNIICVLPGTSDSVILVGAHFDHVDEGDGIIDDWSGASLLPSLYQSLSGASRSHTLVFVGFAGEEQGMVGSEFYAKQLTPEQRKNIVAMVNLECLGVSPTKIWMSHSERSLVNLLWGVAQFLQLPLSGVDVDKVGTTDSESFAHYKIPRITIHSITQETWPLLHSKGDNIKAIQSNLYYDSYRLIAAYLAVLEQQLAASDPVKPKPATR